MTAGAGGVTVTAGEARGFTARCFAAAGLAPEDAAAVAEMMVLADLRGIDTHGITRLPIYVERLRSGAVNRRPQFRIVSEAPATALLDGDNGLGYLVMRHATELAIAKAAACGIGWVGTRMSNHAGAAATYPLMALARDMIGLYLPVAQTNHMAPWGGAEALLGTNPVAVAIPALDEPPVVLDIAATQASNGRIALAAQNEEELQPGWMIDRQGRPLLDARRAIEGLLLPIGGYKGAGLSLVFSLLGATLNGAPTGREVEDADLGGPSHTGQAIMVLNPAAFGPVDAFKRRVDKVARDLRTSQPLPGQPEVRYPGLHGHRTMIEREAKGIPLTAALRRKLDSLADTVGVAAMKIG